MYKKDVPFFCRSLGRFCGFSTYLSRQWPGQRVANQAGWREMVNYLRFLSIFAALWGCAAAIWLGAGHLAITGHEVDVLHVLEAAERLQNGARVHLDFLTPLGVLAFWPISLFLSAGFGADQALILANLAVPLLALPLLAFVAASRMGLGAGALFGLTAIGLGVGGVYGGTNETVSMSLHYNRWCWMFSFGLIALILLEPRGGEGRRRAVEGVVVGALLSALVLTKISYFVSFAPVTLIWLLLWRDAWRLGGVAITGALIFGAVTALIGDLSVWHAYLGDLNFVRLSTIRPYPGASFTQVLARPAYLPGTLVLLAAVITLRRAGLARSGVLLLFLLPGFAFVTYQNWGNDPQWLLILGVVLFVLASKLPASGSEFAGLAPHHLIRALGVAALALGAPSFLNVLGSPVRNFLADPEAFWSPLEGGQHAGLLMTKASAFAPKGRVDLPSIPKPQGIEAGINETDQVPVLVNGTVWPKCNLSGGYMGMAHAIARDLETAGFGEARIGWAASFNPLPLLGAFAREPDRQVWYYGGSRGILSADYVVLPKCPVTWDVFTHYVRALQSADVTLSLAFENEHFALYAQDVPK